MVHFNAVMIISTILFFLGWGVIILAVLGIKKNKLGDKWQIPTCLLGVVVVAVSAGCLIGTADYQRELQPKKFPAKEYTMETVVENNDTTYVITKIVKNKSK